MLIGLVAAITQYSKLPISLPEGSVSAKWLQAGFYEVGSFNVNEQDETRKIEGAKQTKLNRRYIGKLWFPMIEEGLVAPGQHPLIIYQHRYGGSYSEFTRQAHLLASKGYLVLAVNSPTPQTEEKLPEFTSHLGAYALDTRFLLDTASRWNESPETLFYSRVDLNRIGIVGRSLGGVNALVSSFHPRLKDKRIALTATIGGPSQMFSRAFFKPEGKKPLLAISATGDSVVNYSHNALELIDKHHKTWLIGIKTGSHTGFSENAKGFGWLTKSDILTCKNLNTLLASDAWAKGLDENEQDLISSHTINDCDALTSNKLKAVEQLHLSQLGLTAFIEMHFADTQFERNAATDFLSRTVAIENPALQYTAPIK